MEVSQELRNVDLVKAGLYVPICMDELTENVKKTLEAEGYEACDGFYDVWVPDVDRLHVSFDAYDAILWNDSYIDPYQLNWVWDELIQDAEHYLVFQKGYTWDKRSRGIVVDKITDAVGRSYDASIYPLEQSEDKKVLMCDERSHDTPMGSLTYIIALNDQEYEEIKPADYEFVKKFVDRMIAK